MTKIAEKKTKLILNSYFKIIDIHRPKTERKRNRQTD